jgi:hypothetical protein
MSHVIKPNSSITTIGNDISFVCFVLIAFNDCGRYAKVVKNAAAKPKINVKVSNYWICSLMFKPASFDVLVVISRLSPVGSILLYL